MEAEARIELAIRYKALIFNNLPFSASLMASLPSVTLPVSGLQAPKGGCCQFFIIANRKLPRTPVKSP